MPVDDPRLFAPLEGETPYASYLNKLHDAVQSAILHETNPTKEQAQAATETFFAYQNVPGTAIKDEDKENFALNRDTALRAFGAVTTRRALGPNLGLQLEKGKEKRGGKRRIGGADGASEEESDTPATTRRKGSPAPRSTSRSPARRTRSTSRSPARRSASRPLSRGLDPDANDLGGFDGAFDNGFDAFDDFQVNLGKDHAQEQQQQQQQKKQQEPAAGYLSPTAVYAKLEELASQVARCATKEDLQQLATKEEVASLHTKVDDLNTKVEALENEVKDVKKKVEDVQKKVEDVEKKVADVEKKVADVEKKVADVEKKVANVEKKVEVLETTVKDLHKKAEDIGTEVECLPEIIAALERIQEWVDKLRAEDNRKLRSANAGKTTGLSLVPNSLNSFAIPQANSLGSCNAISKLSKEACTEVLTFYGLDTSGTLTVMRKTLKVYLTGKDMSTIEQYGADDDEQEEE